MAVAQVIPSTPPPATSRSNGQPSSTPSKSPPPTRQQPSRPSASSIESTRSISNLGTVRESTDSHEARRRDSERVKASNALDGKISEAYSSDTRTSHSYNTANASSDASGDEWGANFWITIVDPQVRSPLASLEFDQRSDLISCLTFQTQTQFYACPATGQASWDPPAGNFVCVSPPYSPCCFRKLTMSSTACRHRTLESGGSCKTKVGKICHIIITPRLAKRYGRVQRGSSFPSV